MPKNRRLSVSANLGGILRLTAILAPLIRSLIDEEEELNGCFSRRLSFVASVRLGSFEYFSKRQHRKQTKLYSHQRRLKKLGNEGH